MNTIIRCAVIGVLLAAPQASQGQDLLGRAAGALRRGAPTVPAAPAAPAAATAPSATQSPSSGFSSPNQNDRFRSGGGMAGAEIYVTKSRPTSLEDARAKATVEFSDGDEVWVYLHSTSPLSTYAAVETFAGQPEKYEIQVSVTPRGDTRSYNNCNWRLTPEEAAATDLVLSLSPAMARKLTYRGGERTDSTVMNCWLETVGHDNSEAGRWENQILWRSSATATNQQTVATAPITANVPNGFPRWNAAYHKAFNCRPDINARSNAPYLCN